MRVRVPVHVPGMLTLPSSPSQLAPPSHERSSQMLSPVPPTSMLPHAMPSVSDTCSTIRRPFWFLSGTGKVSCRAREGSRVSQYRAHTTVVACAGVGVVTTASSGSRTATSSTTPVRLIATTLSLSSRYRSATMAVPLLTRGDRISAKVRIDGRPGCAEWFPLPSRTSRSGGVAGPQWAAAVVVDDKVAVVLHLQVGVDEAGAEDTRAPCRLHRVVVEDQVPVGLHVGVCGAAVLRQGPGVGGPDGVLPGAGVVEHEVAVALHDEGEPAIGRHEPLVAR